MDMDKDEIERATAHQRKMLRTLRSRLEQRELQEAQQGINSDPQIITEINDLTERVQRHDDEIARLKTLAAEDKEPLAEVEYRALVAKAWDTRSGRPTVVGATQLGFDRLRLGVPVERAQEIERRARVDLCKEDLSAINKYYILGELANLPSNLSDLDKAAWRSFNLLLRKLRKAVQLDFSTVISWFMEAAYIDVNFLPNTKPLLSLHENYVNELTDDEYWLDDAFL